MRCRNDRAHNRDPESHYRRVLYITNCARQHSTWLPVLKQNAGSWTSLASRRIDQRDFPPGFAGTVFVLQIMSISSNRDSPDTRGEDDVSGVSSNTAPVEEWVNEYSLGLPWTVVPVNDTTNGQRHLYTGLLVSLFHPRAVPKCSSCHTPWLPRLAEKNVRAWLLFYIQVIEEWQRQLRLLT